MALIGAIDSWHSFQLSSRLLRSLGDVERLYHAERHGLARFLCDRDSDRIIDSTNWCLVDVDDLDLGEKRIDRLQVFVHARVERKWFFVAQRAPAPLGRDRAKE